MAAHEHSKPHGMIRRNALPSALVRRHAALRPEPSLNNRKALTSQQGMTTCWRCMEQEMTQPSRKGHEAQAADVSK